MSLAVARPVETNLVVCRGTPGASQRQPLAGGLTLAMPARPVSAAVPPALLVSPVETGFDRLDLARVALDVQGVNASRCR
jgi:hypothetical protein